ncbi:MAG: phosphotransferase [Chloroflexi bacterium]|nr:phosphotransferase [Chloroflexota bacterium]
MQIPRTTDEITPEWLTSALRSNGRLSSGRVESITVERTGLGRGFAGSIVRLIVRYAGRGDDIVGAPTTLVAKLPSVDPDIRRYAVRDGMYRRETMFYRELAAKSSIPLPDCYFARLHDESGIFVLLLEDLTKLQEGDEIAGCSVDEAALVIRNLARLHATWWNDERVAGLDWLSGHRNASTKLQDRYLDAWGRATDTLSYIYPPNTFAIGERLGPRLAAFLSVSAEGDQTLNHGDCHLGNLFFRNDEVVMIDWQNVMMTRPALDLAYFIQGSLPAETRRTAEVELLDEYRDTLMGHGVADYSRDRLIEDYRRGLLRSLITSVLSVANLDMEQSDTRELVKTIGTRMVAIADWECGALIPD